jgi:hypothetical protein
MEPHREEQPKAPPPNAERKPKRFRIIKLEDRIAPTSSGTVNAHCRYSSGCTHECNRY